MIEVRFCSRCISRIRLWSVVAVCSSRSPVGSSASSRAGRARPARGRWPPAAARRPTTCRAGGSAGRPGRRAGAGSRPRDAPPRCGMCAMRSGISVFSTASNSGSRWWNWNTNPTRVFRNATRSASVICDRSARQSGSSRPRRHRARRVRGAACSCRPRCANDRHHLAALHRHLEPRSTCRSRGDGSSQAGHGDERHAAVSVIRAAGGSVMFGCQCVPSVDVTSHCHSADQRRCLQPVAERLPRDRARAWRDGRSSPPGGPQRRNDDEAKSSGRITNGTCQTWYTSIGIRMSWYRSSTVDTAHPAVAPATVPTTPMTIPCRTNTSMMLRARRAHRLQDGDVAVLLHHQQDQRGDDVQGRDHDDRARW